MDPGNNNDDGTDLSSVDSEKSEDVTLIELTWNEDLVTGVQVQLGDGQYDAAQGELLFCGSAFTISWQDPTEDIDDLLPVPVSPAAAPVPVSGGAKQTN